MRVGRYLGRAFRAEEIGQWEFCPTILAELARNARLAATGAVYLLWITGRREPSNGGRRGGLRRHLRHLALRRWPSLRWHHHIRRDGRGHRARIKLRSLIVLLNLLALRFDIEAMLIGHRV